MRFIGKNKYKSLLFVSFWVVVFLVNLGPEWQRYSSLREAIEVAGLASILQYLVFVFALKYLVPLFLDKDKLLGFILSLLLLVFVAAEVYILVSYLYLEPTYVETYGAYYENYLSAYNLLERLGFSGMIKYIVLAKLPMLFFPAAILIAANFYQKQKLLLELREQKQAAELSALKNQLNPHFIFNTLNNIYSLAINRSSQTAEAVAKLSGILDYVLYHCNECFVSLTDEIEMIQNYIALEELRFGDRVHISIDNQVEGHVMVAPLLYLSLIENAFKHGAAQELGQANINIHFSDDDDNIVLRIQNSKPQTEGVPTSKKAIGLKNLKRQLELLYPSSHELLLSDTQESYTATLKLRKRTAS